MRNVCVLFFVLLSFVATPLFGGIVYDAVNDFSAAGANPNGPWSYGYATATDYVATGNVTLLTTGTVNLGGTGLNAWTNGSDNWPHVLSSDTDQVQFGTVNFQADALALHPALGNGFGPADTAVVRWIAPSTDLYNISFEFLMLDSSTANSADGTVVGLYVLPSVAPAVPGVIATSPLGPGLGPSYSQSFYAAPITAGSVVDFVVWRGANASQDSTGLRASFTVVPEPGTYALVGCGLLGLAFLRRRRTT